MRISDFGFSFDRSGAVCYQVELRRDEIRNPQSAIRIPKSRLGFVFWRDLFYYSLLLNHN